MAHQDDIRWKSGGANYKFALGPSIASLRQSTDANFPEILEVTQNLVLVRSTVFPHKRATCEREAMSMTDCDGFDCSFRALGCEESQLLSFICRGEEVGGKLPARKSQEQALNFPRSSATSPSRNALAWWVLGESLCSLFCTLVEVCPYHGSRHTPASEQNSLFQYGLKGGGDHSFICLLHRSRRKRLLGLKNIDGTGSLVSEPKTVVTCIVKAT
jgi:hypothetical protein